MKNNPVKSPSEKMNTLSERMNSLKDAGFDEEFAVNESGMVAKDGEPPKIFQPTEVRIDTFYRFEGESDPSDSSVLYAIETNDGLKGVLVDAYGAYADEHTTNFIKEVEEIQKKNATITPDLGNHIRDEIIPV